MKTTITCLLLLFSFSIFSQILNGDFEDWEIDSTNGTPIEIPANWKSNNDHTPWGGSNTPVLKVQGPAGFASKIESNYKGVDAQSSGFLYQEIDLSNIKKISYEARCDSIFKKGFCQIVLFGLPEMDVLYTDTLWAKDPDFQLHEFEVEETWKDDYDFAQLKFIANGEIFELDPQNDGYAAFTVDNVNFEKIAGSNEIARNIDLKLWPNPVSNSINFVTPNNHNPEYIEILNLNGQLVKRFAFQSHLDISDLSDGTYVFAFIFKEAVVTNKVVISL
ncbi:MAG: T9SS type A sorting domain-containing protein [Saprospiraceae bacterium]